MCVRGEALRCRFVFQWMLEQNLPVHECDSPFLGTSACPAGCGRRNFRAVLMFCTVSSVMFLREACVPTTSS